MKIAGFLAALFVLITLASCEKVIDVDIEDASPLIVIEGIITNRTDSQVVTIRKSVPVGEPGNFPPVSGAIVTVNDNAGRIFNMIERRPGVYVNRAMVGRPGRTYTLKVFAEGKEYTGTSTMPDQVSLDSIGVSVSTIFGKEQKTLQLIYFDPGAKPNYYRFLLKVAGQSSKQIFVYDDSFTNGRKVNRELFDLDLNAESGERAEIEMHCIDENMHRYWQGLDQNESRGGASTTPANPVSNLSNGALGYFSAHTRQVESIVVP